MRRNLNLIFFVEFYFFSFLNLPSDKRFGVLEAPSPNNSSDGLDGDGVCTREPDGFLDVIGAEIDCLRVFAKLKGLPSSESLSPAIPSNLFN